MRWSKLKQQIEDRLCESLHQRIAFHSTRYRGTHDQVGRAWITLDKEIIYDFCTVRSSYRFNTLAYELRKKTNCLTWKDAEQAEGYWKAYQIAKEQIEVEGEYNQYQFYKAIEEYINLSIEESLNSEDPMIRGLSMLDKRLGKRRLTKLKIDENEKPIVKILYEIRMQSEGMIEEEGYFT